MLFADVEADGYLNELTKLWTIQLAEDEGDTIVYADQPGYPPLKDGLKRLKDAEKVVIHFGLGFDLWAVNKVYPGTLRREQIIDTVVLSRLRTASSKQHSLADLGEELGIKKGSFDDFSQFSEEMAIYAEQDIRVLQAIWYKRPKPSILSLKEVYEAYPKAVHCEHRVAYAIAKQEQHGFAFNETEAEALYADLAQEKMDLERSLQKVFQPIIHVRYSDKTGKRLKDKVEVFNPGSRQQIADRLIRKYDWDPTKHTPSGQIKVDETVLEDLPYPEAKMIARYLRLGKMMGQLADGDNGWLKLSKNGRINGRVNPIGARTHRMAHYSPNVAQADKDHRMRALYEADKGDVLVGCDAEGLELRMLAHYLANYDGGKYAKTVVHGKKEDGTDVHTVNQKAAEFYTRDGVKTGVYAYLYGSGDANLGHVFRTDWRKGGIEFKESNSKLGKGVRDRLQKGIDGLEALVFNVKRAHMERGGFFPLDGRFVESNSDHSALNTLLQSSGAVVMKWALVLFDEELERRGWEDKVKYCANVHDEVQLSVPPEMADEVGKLFASKITEAGVVLKVRCPLAGSYEIGKNWSETH